MHAEIPGELPDETEAPGHLPPVVRTRVIALSADALGALGQEEVPASLRAFRRFTPVRRAKLAATPLAAALESDPAFRQRVAARVREGVPVLADVLDRGDVPAAADPLDVAAVAYLLRPPGWASVVAAAVEEVDRVTAGSRSSEAAESVARLQDQLAAARTQARQDLDRVRVELRAAKDEIAQLRRKLKDARDAAAAADTAAREADAALEQERSVAGVAASAADAEQRRLRQRLTEAETALETARRTAREGRAHEDARLRLLLDTVVEASQGLRRELALPPTTVRPADAVAAVRAEEAGVDDVAERALDVHDPARLDQLLAIPQVHLVIDGYNVTKTGYGELPLEAQRQRLLTGLGPLAARSGAEVTVCFDGAALDSRVVVSSPRGVRVLFSRAGETADELIRRLVRHEPSGRPVVVVSSDREVADGVRRCGARPVASAALVRALERS